MARKPIITKAGTALAGGMEHHSRAAGAGASAAESPPEGASLSVLNLVTTERPFFRQQVAAVERRGVSCTTVTVPGTFDPERGTSRSPLDYVRFYGRVLGHVLDEYDVIHANYGLTAPAALAQPRRPVVLTLWGSDVFGEYGWVSKRCAPAFDAVVVMSSELGAALDCESHVVPHPVDLDRFRPEPTDPARDVLDWSDEAHHLLFPYSRNRTVKDYPRAERVAARAAQHLDRAVEVHAVTGVDHDRMSTYMNAADALLLTSKREGSPNAVKEAMACNLPVVATDVGDVAELLADVSPSAVCETDDALVEALRDVLRAEQRSDGRDVVEAYGVDRMGEQLTDLYRSVTR
jgi:glycosyltransferase involved in cell wall biosynthesis